MPNDTIRSTALDQFLKAIKKATSDAQYPGLPMYVNPTGLVNDAGKTLESPVDCFLLKSGKVRHLLRKALGQLHLSYAVRDGFLMISSREEIVEERLDELDQKLDRLLEATERLDQARGNRRPDRRKQ